MIVLIIADVLLHCCFCCRQHIVLHRWVVESLVFGQCVESFVRQIVI